MITQSLLQEYFDYSNGKFTRKSNGKEVVCNPVEGQAYLRLYVNGKTYALHRLIFLHQHGFLPEVVDHIDGNRFNNNIENLRAATQQQNCLNKRRKITSSSPCKNVHKASSANPKWKQNWVVSLTVDGKRRYIGSFEDLELADLVAQEARNKYHGQFARHY